MAAVRLVADADNWSLSRGLKDYFACCFPSANASATKQQQEKQSSSDVSYSSSNAKKVAVVDGICPSPSPRTTQRVRCTHRSLSEDDDDDAAELLDRTSSRAATRPEADGASVHSAGTDRSASGRSAGARSEQAIREGLDTMLTAASETAAADADEDGRRRSAEGGGSLSGSGSGIGGSSIDRNSLNGGCRRAAREHGGVDGVDADVAASAAADTTSQHGSICSNGHRLNGGSGSADDVNTPQPNDQTTSENAVTSHDAVSSADDVIERAASVADERHVNDEDEQLGGETAGRGRSLSGSERVFVDEASTADEHSKTPPSVHFADTDETEAGNQPKTAKGGPVSTCGSLRMTLKYDAARRRLTVGVHEALELPSEDRGGAGHTQVRVVLLPAKKLRHKTRVKPGTHPVFDETFEFKVQPDDLKSMGLRMRLYGCERLRRERLIGECILSFSSFNQLTDSASSTSPAPPIIEHWIQLEPRSNISHGDSLGDLTGVGGGSAGSLSAGSDCSGSSNLSLQHGGMPELMLGLNYNETTGRLSVEVIKGSNFKNFAVSRPPDTCVKLALMSSLGQEITHSKTSVRRAQPNPLFKETFMFQVPQSQLPDVSLLVSVFTTRSLNRKEMIGWFTMGMTNSSDEELSHWTSMRENQGEQVCRWHLLLEP